MINDHWSGSVDPIYRSPESYPKAEAEVDSLCAEELLEEVDGPGLGFVDPDPGRLTFCWSGSACSRKMQHNNKRFWRCGH